MGSALLLDLSATVLRILMVRAQLFKVSLA